jgi:hypothetical protein
MTRKLKNGVTTLAHLIGQNYPKLDLAGLIERPEFRRKVATSLVKSSLLDPNFVSSFMLPRSKRFEYEVAYLIQLF